jgi:hypothetical protein
MSVLPRVYIADAASDHLTIPILRRVLLTAQRWLHR